MNSWAPLRELLSSECRRTTLTISKLRFKQWLCASRQQGITWANININRIFWHHMAALVHNELKRHQNIVKCPTNMLKQRQSIVRYATWHSDVYSFRSYLPLYSHLVCIFIVSRDIHCTANLCTVIDMKILNIVDALHTSYINICMPIGFEWAGHISQNSLDI